MKVKKIGWIRNWFCRNDEEKFIITVNIYASANEVMSLIERDYQDIIKMVKLNE